MHILAGQYKGRALKRPRGIRLTSEKVKGAIFNILADAITDARFLDICAGSGSVGLEALSRGASSVTWVERDPACCRVLKENVECVCGASAGANILRQDASAALRQLGSRGASFDLIFTDPPYDDIPLIKKTLQGVEAHAILRASGWLVVEHERRVDLSQLVDNIEIARQYHYGDTVLSVCRHPSAS